MLSLIDMSSLFLFLVGCWFFDFIATMVYSQIATLANETRVQLPFFVGTASRQLYATPLVVAILAKAL